MKSAEDSKGLRDIPYFHWQNEIVANVFNAKMTAMNGCPIALNCRLFNGDKDCKILVICNKNE